MLITAGCGVKPDQREVTCLESPNRDQVPWAKSPLRHNCGTQGFFPCPGVRRLSGLLSPWVLVREQGPRVTLGGWGPWDTKRRTRQLPANNPKGFHFKRTKATRRPDEGTPRCFY